MTIFLGNWLFCADLPQKQGFEILPCEVICLKTKVFSPFCSATAAHFFLFFSEPLPRGPSPGKNFSAYNYAVQQIEEGPVTMLPGWNYKCL